jgi:predicted ester cyclase
MKLNAIFTELLGIMILIAVICPSFLSAQDPAEIRAFVNDQIAALTSENWQKEILKRSNKKEETAEFIKEHQVFRDAFANFKIEIKHLVVEGNEVIMWGQMSATHVAEFPREEFKGLQATNKEIEWTEVWFFDVVDGHYGEQFDWTVDGVSRMKQLGIKCLPE